MENLFRQQLVKLRRQKNLSQEQLASRLFVSRQSISKWEQGETTPDLNTLVSLANIFDVGLDELVGGEQVETSMGDDDWRTERRSTNDEMRRHPMNGWEFLAGYWWLLVPLAAIFSSLFH
ncbi:helix-turn-helix domain-containing protein [Levilactobacillus enshiensis]|uniref:helix-turn-helix domain-containing protein n=1 Tax=Levilactobacillus enshiensis TaxID=2590213 RepID=UPI00117A3720|nr:helix-turn-helix transcriptional regulator [Levilactobacillus enshiensis]